jgi:hypothetical protein
MEVMFERSEDRISKLVSENLKSTKQDIAALIAPVSQKVTKHTEIINSLVEIDAD